MPALEAAIDEYVATHTANPNPLVWTAKAGAILAKVNRDRAP